MNELNLFFNPYELKLKKPFKMAGVTIKSRKGFLIKLQNKNGDEGLGDCCPFPEIGSESLVAAEAALTGMELKIKLDFDNVRNSLNFILKDFQKLPSIRHGIEQALINLICAEKNITINKLLSIRLNKEIEVNAVIGILPKEKTISKAKILIDEGFKTIKIKCGRDNFDDDYSMLTTLRELFGNKIKLRIDVNGKWNPNEAMTNLKKMTDLNLEYIEQPVKNISDFLILKKLKGICLAADESVRSLADAKKIISQKSADILILKPMIIGGLIPTIEIIDLAIKNNIESVVTSSFESAIGRTNAVIAASYAGNNFAHGLGINNLFENDLIENKFEVNKGKIILN